MQRILPRHLWPIADQHVFADLLADGGLLDDRGPLAQWRAPSRRLMEQQYGRWLDWLQKAEPDAIGLHPIERATPPRLRAWLASMDDLAPATRLGYADAVVRVCRLTDPARDWHPQHVILAQLRRASRQYNSPRKSGRVLSSNRLFEAGERLIRENFEHCVNRDQAVRLRDGAIICLLAFMPMRRRALSELRLGTSLLVTELEMIIHLDGGMTKNGQHWEATVPDRLRTILSVYIKKGRRLLSDRSTIDTDALWLGRNGLPLGVNQFTRAISKRTKELLGVAISPHLFRDAAATTLARTDAASARLIKPILGHSSERIAEQHYIRADTIEAGRGLAEAIGRLSKDV